MAILQLTGRRGAGVVPLVARPGWFRRAVLLALTVGVIVMHHLVAGLGPHQPPIATAVFIMPSVLAAVVVAVAPDEAATGSSGLRARPGPAVMPDPSSGAAASEPVAHPRGPGGHGDGMVMMAHLCLAVLAGLIALAASALAVLWRSHPARCRVGALPAGARSGLRAPPVPVRLAQLQVLRL